MVNQKEVQKRAITFLLIGLVVGFALGYFVFDDMGSVDFDSDSADQNTPVVQLDGATVEVNIVDSTNGGN